MDLKKLANERPSADYVISGTMRGQKKCTWGGDIYINIKINIYKNRQTLRLYD